MTDQTKSDFNFYSLVCIHFKLSIKIHTSVLTFFNHYETTVASNELILRTTSFQVYQDPAPLRILYQVKAN